MKRIIVVAAIMLSVTGLARAETLAEKTGINSVLGVSPSTHDFVTEASISNLFEIKAADIAKSRDSSGPVNNFANKMIDDHTKIGAELKSLVADGSVKEQIPTDLDPSHQKMLDQLKDANEKDFDPAYIDGQITAHKNTINLFERYAKGGNNEKLKEWASDKLPKLKEHLQMAEALNTNKNEDTANNNMATH